MHCHNDLGLAVANSLAAVQAGARQVECTINGIGERAGNCSLEEVVMILKIRQDILPYRDRHPDRAALPGQPAADQLITFGPQPNKAIVGRNAFAHEAGIHQDGLLKERTTYEIMDPTVGGRAREPPGAGQAQRPPRARASAARHSATRSTRDQLDEVYTRFIALADRKKGVIDHEISEIAAQVTRPGRAWHRGQAATRAGGAGCRHPGARARFQTLKNAPPRAAAR